MKKFRHKNHNHDRCLLITELLQRHLKSPKSILKLKDEVKQAELDFLMAFEQNVL